MALYDISFYSQSLIRPVSFQMFLPNDPREGTDTGNIRTLFLLHGYTGAAGLWGHEQLAEQYRVALVMPSGENAFYLDGLSTGHKFATFLGQELVGYLRRTFRLAQTPEETGICGLSMGGFGALHTGLAYPETFGWIGAMSSALIVHSIAHMKPGQSDSVANYDYYHECFGDLETVEERDTNPEVQIDALKAAGRTLPQIYLCCGTEDFLLEHNRTLHRFLTDRDVPHVYRESKGNHDGVFWNEYTPKIMEWMFG